MRNFLAFFVTLTLAMLVSPAFAGRYHIRYTSEGIVAVRMGEDSKGPYMDWRGLPMTGEYNPGPAAFRLNGVVIDSFVAAPYQGRIYIQPGTVIHAMSDKDIGVNGISNHNAKDIVVDDMFFGLQLNLELYFVGQDSRGHQKKDASAAPATQIVIEREPPIPVASTKGGQVMTADQLDAAIKQAYEQGKNDGTRTTGDNSETLLRKIKDLTDENNRLKVELAERGGSTAIKICRYLPVAWTCGEPVPKLHEQLTVYLNGHSIASASVVEVVTVGSGQKQYSRVWVKMDVMSDIDLDRSTIQRLRPQGGN